MKKESGFSGARRGNNESSLSTSDGCHEVDEAGGKFVRSGFEADLLGGVDRFQFFEGGELAGFFGFLVVDRCDFDHLRTSGAIASEAFDPDTGAKSEFTSEVGWNEDVFFGLLEVLGSLAKEAEAFWGELEESVDGDGIAGEFKGLAWFAVVVSSIARAIATNSA